VNKTKKDNKLLTLKLKDANTSQIKSTSRIKQSFSHGKSRSVEVEIKGKKKQITDFSDKAKDFPNLTQKEIKARMDALSAFKSSLNKENNVVVQSNTISRTSTLSNTTSRSNLENSTESNLHSNLGSNSHSALSSISTGDGVYDSSSNSQPLNQDKNVSDASGKIKFSSKKDSNDYNMEKAKPVKKIS
jgi:hypothetical protein